MKKTAVTKKQPETPFRRGTRHAASNGKREAILRVAARCFVTRGIVNTSLDDIAAELGITKPSLYYYIKSKDDIVRQCLDRQAALNIEMIEQITRLKATGREKLRRWALAYCQGLTDDFGKCLVLLDINALSEGGRAAHLSVQREMLAATQAFIAAGMRDRSLKPCDPKVAAFALVGAMNSMAYWFNPEGRLSGPDVALEMIRLLEEGLAA